LKEKEKREGEREERFHCGYGAQWRRDLVSLEMTDGEGRAKMKLGERGKDDHVRGAGKGEEVEVAK
jgi:hypothetical protein